jgi:hypothetical protein
MTPLGRGDVVWDNDTLVVNQFEFSFGLRGVNHFLVTLILIPFGFFELTRVRSANRNERDFKILTISILAVVTALHVLTFSETRYRLPFDSLLCLSTAVFFAKCTGVYEKSNWVLSA